MRPHLLTQVGLVVLFVILADVWTTFRSRPRPMSSIEWGTPIRQVYAETKAEYARRVGMNACLAATGEYVGRVVEASYGRTRGAQQWSYTVRSPEQPGTAIRRTWTDAATFWTVTADACPNGRP